MSSVVSFISGIVFSPFMQDPAVQNIAAAVMCIRQGKQLFWNTDHTSTPALEPSRIRKYAVKAAGVLLLTIGIAGVIFPFFGSSNHNQGESNHNRPLIASYEDQFYSHHPQVKIKPYMDRAQVLFLGAAPEADHNGAFTPIAHYNESLPECLVHTIRKVKYVTVTSIEQMCKEIQAAPTVKDVVLGFHGAYNAMQITATLAFWVFNNQLLPSCFDSLPPEGRIFLQSCSTGEHSFRGPNVAEWLSWISGREVVAPSDLTNYATCMKEGGRLNIEFYSNGTQITRHFNTATSMPETLLFGLKTASSALMGTMAAWQTMRLAASLMQGTGAATRWIVDACAPQTKRIAKATHLYNPQTAQILYDISKAPCVILNGAGSLMHQGMDLFLHPVNTVFQNCVWGAAKLSWSAARLGVRGIQQMTSKF